MTEPNPLPYASMAPNSSVDLSHLKTLAICHYVMGGIAIAFSCIFIIHVVLGLMMARGGFPGPATSSLSPPPPPALGYMMASMGGCAVLTGWSFGALTIYSGISISRRKRHLFSLIMAGVNCASVPFGTVLGVFTFIVLLRPSVKALYDFSSPQHA